jgi:hypothetical protein
MLYKLVIQEASRLTRRREKHLKLSKPVAVVPIVSGVEELNDSSDSHFNPMKVQIQ